MPESVIRIITPEKSRSLLLNLKEVLNYHELLSQITLREIKVRYKQTALGIIWAILQPLSLMIIFTLFFGRFAKIPSEGIPYPIFYYSALLPWQYFSTSPLVIQLWMFASPIIYPLSIIPERFRTLYLLNPMAGIIASYRRIIVKGLPPETFALSLAIIISIIVFFLGYRYFKKIEMSFADVI